MSYKKLIPPKYNTKIDNPNGYFPFENECIISTFDFSFEDICDLYNLSIEPMIKKDEFLKEKAKEYPVPMDVGTDEEYHLMRMNQSINEQSSKLNSMNSFLNQVTSVYIWVLVEQTENKLIHLIEKKKNNNQGHDGFTDWKRRKKYFKNLNVYIEDLSSYFDVLELQKLNNKIKHLGKVDQELSGIATFKNKEGYLLEHVTIPIEKYLNRAYYYVLELFNEVEDKIFPETKRM